ncbi:RagB/SusD family nutrient uptake outer membrane protein [Paraflavitalea sp. CAU 1676]|uniref:RagB/SusD family nutrient uptake outer membrane protein n=1 Tax=Paraflavitalea sp. CAU 1676 TaxID=3032598 RepID=UPI0023DC61D7|nr:RagB/SusD family nutrient uptake outer membrane protein [Paraflavitalea sp. CAU 1676]MDF2193319.1 RagB/SusD family nutrient uptake outer membrane protein [Paraflavitalea sp. CAU 1676]
MKSFKLYGVLLLLLTTGACKKYLDVVPDNVATIDNAFTLRSSAERYLFTCYSYMPRSGSFNDNPAMNAGDELWYMFPSKDINTNFWNIARGEQNASSPLGNFWEGTNSGRPLFTGIRDCNIFLENIHHVPDMDRFEKDRWSAEVKFLKAYYHFYLLRMYGPIPVTKVNLLVGSKPEAVKVYRDHVDSGFNYVVQLLDEVMENEQLPDRIVGTEATELGRITKSIVTAFKAKVLVTAASPLFNGNTEYAGMSDPKSGGKPLFNTTLDPQKWARAAEACKQAIEFCHTNGYSLYKYTGAAYNLVPETRRQLDIRGAVTDKEFNSEVIWHNTLSRAGDIQRWCMPLINAGTASSGPKGIIAPPIKMAELFYSKNGVPIDQDITYDYSNRYALRKAVNAERFYVKPGEETVQLHYDREPRFYANLGFDRGIWYGNWINNYDTTGLAVIRARKGETAARQGISNFSITGYWIKKLVGITTACAADGAMTTVQYPWPEMRLADLYLLYAEALNEAGGPSSGALEWINLVRARAGLKTVEESWSNYARENAKFSSKAGLRDIIQQERLIELAFEGQRFWDLRRWKLAHEVLNRPIKGWDIEQLDPAAYYKEVLLFNQTFRMREYFWPISINELLTNRNLVQNTGW